MIDFVVLLGLTLKRLSKNSVSDKQLIFEKKNYYYWFIGNLVGNNLLELLQPLSGT